MSLTGFACDKKIRTGTVYYRYAYDMRTDSFLKIGATLSFGKGFTTFEYTYAGGDLAINGSVEHTSVPDSYIITCADEVVSIVADRYRQTLIDNGADQSQLDFYDAVSEVFTPKAQYYVYEGRLFTGDSIELFHAAEGDTASFEGIYRMDSSEDTVRIYGGYVYSKDEDGKYTKKSGKYTVSRGILTLISLDEKGKERYQNGVLMKKRYFMAKVKIPKDGDLVATDLETQLKSSEFVSKINADISAYSGKTVAVLCESYLSN